jgi:hypothetical protein
MNPNKKTALIIVLKQFQSTGDIGQILEDIDIIYPEGCPQCGDTDNQEIKPEGGVMCAFCGMEY